MPFPRSTWPDMGEPGRIRYTFADSPKVGGHRGVPCRKGQAPSLRGGDCGFAQNCGKMGALLRGTPGTAFPTGHVRIRRTFVMISPLLRGGGVGTPPPTRPLRVRPFLPPAGEGGIRRSPARRMTEEGERDRQQTVKSFAYPHPCNHFHSALPPRSPSPAALVGGTLPRRGRERTDAAASRDVAVYSALPTEAQAPSVSKKAHKTATSPLPVSGL